MYEMGFIYDYSIFKFFSYSGYSVYISRVHVYVCDHMQKRETDLYCLPQSALTNLLCRRRWLLTQRPVSLCLPSAWIKLGVTTAQHIFCLALDPLELESQMLGATLWLKGIKPRSSGRPFT